MRRIKSKARTQNAVFFLLCLCYNEYTLPCWPPNTTCYYFQYLTLQIQIIISKLEWTEQHFWSYSLKLRSVYWVREAINKQWVTLFLGSLGFHHAAAAAASLQSCLTLCDPIDSSPPGSPVPGILQARTLEWLAISFSNAWKWKVKVKSLSHVQLLATP